MSEDKDFEAQYSADRHIARAQFEVIKDELRKRAADLPTTDGVRFELAIDDASRWCLRDLIFMLLIAEPTFIEDDEEEAS